MESVKHLSPFYAVTTQLRPGDLGALAAEGVQTIIKNSFAERRGRATSRRACSSPRAAERLGVT
ncbi:MAG: hypothetical protein U5L11_02925 [Arhodomonas sp.]|nr:hypothetical protein [Arhodomonas sp.]